MNVNIRALLLSPNKQLLFLKFVSEFLTSLGPKSERTFRGFCYSFRGH